MLRPGKSAWPSDIPLRLHFFAGLKQRHLIARRAVVDRTFACLRYALVGQRLVMDGHADRKSAGTESMKATPAATTR